MSSALLESQLADLEPPTDALVVNFQKSPKKIVAEVIQSLEPV